jgi:hypothetical protein
MTSIIYGIIAGVLITVSYWVGKFRGAKEAFDAMAESRDSVYDLSNLKPKGEPVKGIKVADSREGFKQFSELFNDKKD